MPESNPIDAAAAAVPTKRKRRPRRQDVKPTFIDDDVAKLERRAKPYVHPDPDLPHHCIRVRLKGPFTFTVVCRDPYGTQKWVKVGNTGVMTIDQARVKAREIIERIKAGADAIPKPPVQPDSVEKIATDWLKRHVEKNGLRTAAEMRRVVDKYILPHWAARTFVDIKRSHIAELLDHVEDKHGAYMADAVLTVLRSISVWYSKRDDAYVAPFVPKMSRVPPETRKRERTLEDAEIRSIWRAAGDADTFGSLVKLLLLTGQRRAKVVGMRWSDVSTGVWTIPREPREKGSPKKLRLPASALAIVNDLPRLDKNNFVFAGNKGHRAFAFAREKAELDKSSGVNGWRLHDLRRTARSLLSRARVRPDVAELIIGHAVGGVKEIYDRYNYAREIAAGLKKLAALIKRIVAGPIDNVVDLDEERLEREKRSAKRRESGGKRRRRTRRS